VVSTFVVIIFFWFLLRKIEFIAPFPPPFFFLIYIFFLLHSGNLYDCSILLHVALLLKTFVEFFFITFECCILCISVTFCYFLGCFISFCKGLNLVPCNTTTLLLFLQQKTLLMYCEELVQLLVRHEQCVVIVCCCLHHNKQKPKNMSLNDHCTIKHIRKELTITQKTTTKKTKYQTK